MTGSHLVDVLVDVDGRPVATRIGSGQEPTVVFISALGQRLTDWTQVVEGLTTAPMTVTFDRPAIGDTPPRPGTNPPMPYSAFASELANLLEALKIAQSMVLVGHSFGSLIARAFALRWPARLAGMVHVDGSLPTLDLGSDRRPRIDGDGETGTVVDGATDAVAVAEATPPQVPTVVLSRAVGWWYPPPAVAPPDEDARWHQHHADLAARSGGVRIVADHAGHQLPREAPDLVALAVNAVVEAVRNSSKTISIPSAAVRSAGGYIAGQVPS
jgi:pimeloyl-ACP methyl ester carboxylesterase